MIGTLILLFYAWLFVVGPLVFWLYDKHVWAKRKREYERRAREQGTSPDAPAS